MTPKRRFQALAHEATQLRKRARFLRYRSRSASDPAKRFLIEVHVRAIGPISEVGAPSVTDRPLRGQHAGRGICWGSTSAADGRSAAEHVDQQVDVERTDDRGGETGQDVGHPGVHQPAYDRALRGEQHQRDQSGIRLVGRPKDSTTWLNTKAVVGSTPSIKMTSGGRTASNRRSHKAIRRRQNPCMTTWPV